MTLPPKRGAPTIKALFFDVDGVLTDGRVYIDDQGCESKVFDTKDGHGVKMAVAAGLNVAWISGRTSKATEQRARELGVAECHQGVSDKGGLFDALCRRWGVTRRETAAIGDDEPDVPMLVAAGFSACPADAAPQARKAAQVVLKNAGGRGAVREFVEHILRYNKLVEKTALSTRTRKIAIP
jgi:3-deoxy-D-manno-octulosonate 8-phosphate phosphatase (KDO 8-P phosphatase)